MGYGWVENGECLFDVEVIKVKSKGDGNEFIDHSPLKRRLQNAAKQDEPVGLIFLPKGTYSADIEDAAVAAIAIGRNKLAPTIKHLYVVVPPEEKLKVNLRRKALAYSPKNIVLVDQAYGGLSHLSEDELFYSDGKWQIAERYLEVPDTSYSRAASLRAMFHAEEKFVLAVTGKCEYSWANLDDELPDGAASLGDKIASFVRHRNVQAAEAKRLYNVLSAHKFDNVALRDMFELDVQIALEGKSEPNGFCKWYNGWAYASSGKRKGWHNVDDFTDKDSELKARIRQMYLLPEYRDYIAELERDEKRAIRIREIWERVLRMNECPLVLPASLSRPKANDVQKEQTDKTLSFIAETYGIDAIVGAWADGVPYNDIFA